MKKTVIIYALALVGLFAVLSVLGQKGDYAVEKAVWKIYREHEDIAKDPMVIPDVAFEKVIRQYEEVIRKYPDSRLIPRVWVRLGEIYAVRKNYEEARNVFEKIVTLYPDDQGLCAEVTFKIGKTYEVVDDWVEASRVYTSIISKYPETEIALGIPIYIAGYYKKQNDFQKTIEAYEIAINYYRRMAADYEGQRNGVNALRFLSNCYLEQNRWEEAISTMGRILENYTTSGFLAPKDIDMNIKTINIISSYQMKNYDIAINLYQGILDRNPGFPLEAYLNRVISAFKQLQEKGVMFLDKK